MSEPRSIEPVGFSRAKRNTTGTLIPRGSIVAGAGAMDEIKLAEATDVQIGVASYDIPDGEYGTVQLAGLIPVRVSADVLPNRRLTVDPASPGHAIEAAPGAGTAVPFVGVSGTAATAGSSCECEQAPAGSTIQG
jgi:hypothetical protein